MTDAQSLATETVFFTSCLQDGILRLDLKADSLLSFTDLADKESLFSFLDAAAGNDAVKALLIMGAAEKRGGQEHFDFYRRVTRPGASQKFVARFYNAVNQLVLKMADFPKVLVHADRGRIIPLFMNLSLPSDYRLVADNAVFENPNMELDTVSKGGGAFFLSRMIGPAAAAKVLLSTEPMSANQALELGIVDKVVPEADLEREALALARKFADRPARALLGVKKLLRCCLAELENSLRMEDSLLLRTVTGQEFWNRLEACSAESGGHT